MKCHSDCRCHTGAGADVSFLTPDLAVGGMVHPHEITDLRALGITHVISVNWPDRPEYPEVIASFQHLNLAIIDDALPKPVEWFRAGIDFANTLNPGDKLLVHCGHGINRSPAMAYAILRSRGVADAEAVVRAGRYQTGSVAMGVYRESADLAMVR